MTQHTGILLSTACFAPVQYMTKFLKYDKIMLEQHEHFAKQTFRNRYEILGANGQLALVVPVAKGRGRKIPIRDLRISYDTDWQRIHWRTIFSAYNSSPFFEYYCDDLYPFFTKKWDYLFDFNREVLETLCELLDLEPAIGLTTQFESVSDDTLNFREAITPKQHKAAEDPHFGAEPYTQVFSGRYGFVENLSILDLLFNEGPNSINVLQKSIV